MDEKKKEVKINFPENLVGGTYSNNMFVTHTREEFVMDFLMVAPPSGTVTSRVIVSPGHMKRTLKALQDNLKKYEEQYGEILTIEAPDLPGFEPPSRH
ncbi:MAG: DUF3467 domain-containing protein [Deltaproteobacteria bacterium]|nr:DUF3467 domain-containing protein [Deltaproteobacteria bacterium]